MCIFIRCSSVLCVCWMALDKFMFVKVMSSLISVMSPLLVCALCLCVWWIGGIVGYFWCFSFLYEFCFLHCDDIRLGAVHEFFSSSILLLMPFMLI